MASYNDVFGGESTPSWLTAKECDQSSSVGAAIQCCGFSFDGRCGTIGSEGTSPFYMGDGAEFYSVPARAKQSCS
ncbi:hypothetical protein R1flu_012072 [Riccia fluitans]|uniref:Uncharacterized protein n=1 Tax=Riccia fluitans TaxID=41844 RepID=A0ABD1Z9T3_9MARC